MKELLLRTADEVMMEYRECGINIDYQTAMHFAKDRLTQPHH